MSQCLCINIAEREEGRLKTDLNKLKQQQDDLKEVMNTYENTIYTSNKKSEDLRQKMNWNQEVCDASHCKMKLINSCNVHVIALIFFRL